MKKKTKLYPCLYKQNMICICMYINYTALTIANVLNHINSEAISVNVQSRHNFQKVEELF